MKTKEGIQYEVRSQGKAAGYCALSIKVGTRDEGAYHSGIAHFLEHTLFKGTSRKSASTINGFLEKTGGELNAFTAKEEIVLHATVLSAEMEKAASLLMEIAFDAQFPSEEIEVEKGVVIDEIASYKDSPADDIYDVFEEKLFAGSSLSRPILGTEESVRQIDADELRRFRKEFFVPGRMTFTMVSPLPAAKMKGIIEKLSAKWAGADPGIPPRRKNGVGEVPCTRFDITEDKGNNEVNCILGSKAPSLGEEKDRLTAILLCNILGGPASNSLLGAVLREKHGWVYNVDCSYTPYSDTGIAAIMFGCEKENLAKCEKTIRRELQRIQEKPLSEPKLKMAKKQLLGQNTIGMENGEALCISMGKSLMAFGRIMSDGEAEEKIAAISAEDVRLMACRLFDKEKLSRLVYL